MRLINADALMQTLGITDMDCEKCGWYSRAYRRCKRGGDFEDACCAIEDAPTIEVVPERKKGRWIVRDNPGTGWYRVTCSECGEDVTSTIPMIGFFPDAKPLWDYCPNCGCAMTEGAEE